MVLWAVHMALTDPSFAVQDRYYSKALLWDEQVAAERRSTALGWRADVSTYRDLAGSTDVAVSLVDRDGHPVHGARIGMEAFSVARSNRIVRTSFVEGVAGEYHARVVTERGGRWELSVDATRGADRFTSTIHQDLGGV